MSAPSVLVHLCGEDEWRRARTRGEHRPESLVASGFIHLSTPEQVHLPANRLYLGRTDLVLLYVDQTRLRADVRWEAGVASDPESMVFPHLYGPLPTSAVISVMPYRGGSSGRFEPLAGGA